MCLRRLFASICLLFIVAGTDLSSQESADANPGRINPVQTIAVTPFHDNSAGSGAAYIGFQISEYLTSALAAFPELSVIERGQLQSVMDEQKLALSGLIDDATAVKVGEIVQAGRLLVGSYTLSGTNLTVNGRIVDTESGTILSSAVVEGYYKGNITAVLKPFFYQIIGKEPPEKLFSEMSAIEQRLAALENRNGSAEKSGEIAELQQRIAEMENRQSEMEGAFDSLILSLEVEAKLSILDENSTRTSVDYAKALEASFSGEKSAALDYLRGLVSDPAGNLINYGDASDDYFQQYSSLEGSSFYAQLIKQQLDLNDELSREAQLISEHRATLKLFTDRMRAIMSPNMFELSVGTKESMELSSSRAAAAISLPSNISVSVRSRYRDLVSNLIDSQETIDKNFRGLKVAQPPRLVKLLPYRGIEKLFKLSFSAGTAHAIQFIGTDGTILYELESEHYTPFVLSDSPEERWSFSYTSDYTVSLDREGWTYKDGKVTVQARELKDLASVRTILRNDAYNSRYSFPAYGNARWKSILMHGFRRAYLKPGIDGKTDPMPSVKDIVISHSLFSVDGFMDSIPLLIDPQYLSGAADLTAVVYWADETSASVSGNWSGVLPGENEAQVGNFTPNTVLYFPQAANTFSRDNRGIRISAGDGTFTISTPDARKSASFRLVSGRSWHVAGDSPDDLNIDRGIIFTAQDRYSDDLVSLTADGKLIWKSTPKNLAFTEGDRTNYLYGNHVRTVDGFPFMLYRNHLAKCNPETGKPLWLNGEVEASSDLLIAAGGILFAGGGNTVSVDAESGTSLWEKNIYAKSMALAGGRLFIAAGSRTYCLDAATGDTIWEDRNYAGDLILKDGKVITTNYRNRRLSQCLDSATGSVLWKSDEAYGDNIVSTQAGTFIAASGTTYRIDPDSGKILWKHEGDGGLITPYRDQLILKGNDVSSLDPESGRRLWKSSWIDGFYSVGYGYLYRAFNGVAAVDLRTLEPWFQYAEEGDAAYNRDDYPAAAEAYRKAVYGEGCDDGIVLYRLAFSTEKLEGSTERTAALYQSAIRALSTQYPGHRYTEPAKSRAGNL